MLFKLLCVLALCLIASCSGGSSGRAKERQYCGENRFYCPSTSKCLDRNLRCTASKVCVDSSGKEAKCFEASASRYNYYRKKASILSSGSKRKRAIEDFYHWFVEYRGFVYEFGSYGVQELDVNDPNYKYGPRREKVTSVEWMGTSTCTRSDVLKFRADWDRDNREWTLIDSNCQEFVKSLEKRLRSNCPARKGRSLDDEKGSLKANCTVSKQTRLASNSMVAFFVPVLILFAIFDSVCTN